MPDPAPHVWRGAFHVHTTRSDGALPTPDVAAAAARAGLDFVIFTDHGDGTRPPDPPTYLHGVLCVDGVEISTNDGHYIALDMPAAPYPLGGDAAAVAEDVARLGGFGVAAHPTSPRAELAWRDWQVPIDALEWMNADSEWRDESWGSLLRSFVHYPWRPAGALARLLDRPEGAIAKWDRLTPDRRVVALAGHDAHGGFGTERGDAAPARRLHLPSYDASFRTFSLYVATGRPRRDDASGDAIALLDAIRGGRVFTAVDALAGPASLQFVATAGETEAQPGDLLSPGAGPARFEVRASAPPGARTLLLRAGEVIAEAAGGVLDHRDDVPGAYRVEIRVAGAPGHPPVPWVLTNPIYYVQPPDPLADDPEASWTAELLGIAPSGWQLESSPGSSGGIVVDRERISLLFRLDADRTRSPFVALATALGGIPDGANEIAFFARADEQMRLSVQLRFADHEANRWGRSVYLDATPREVRVPIDRLRPAGREGPRPPVPRAMSLLFVVDLTNSREGSEGRFTVWNVRLEDVRRRR